MLTAFVLSTALAADGPLVPRFDGGPLTFKVDVIQADPGFRYSSDARPMVYEQWSAVLTCTPELPRRYMCTFNDDEFHYGTLYSGAAEPLARPLPAPGELEVSFNKRGRLTSFDIVNPRTAFRDEVPAFLVQARFSRDNRRPKGAHEGWAADFWELEIGAVFASAFDWELPKGGVADANGWRMTTPPRATLADRSALASARLHIKPRVEGGAALLSIAGTVTESGGQTAYTTEVEAEVRFDGGHGRVTQVRAVRKTTSTAQVSGYRREMTLVKPWVQGDPTEPISAR